jgi:hypothetical protein
MGNENPFDAIDPSGTISLAVGWPSGARTKLRSVAISEDVANAFRDVVEQTLADLAAREPEEWTPEADLSPETYLTIDVEHLGKKPELATEHGEVALMDALLAAEDLPNLDPRNLPAGNLSFYAVAVGEESGNRAVFLRRTNPRRGLKRGRIYSIFNDTLQRVEDPIFAFDEWMDLVVVDGKVAVLSQTVFAALFRGQDTLNEQIPTWASDLNEAVPIAEAGLTRLRDKALRDSRARQRLESIVRRGHLKTVAQDKLREAMTTAGLDAERLIDEDGAFLMEEEDISSVLYFLNEDLFAGALTETNFRADKKAAR